MDNEESKKLSSLFFPGLDPLFAAELMGEDDQLVRQETERSNTSLEETSEERPTKRPYQQREYIARVPKEEANWYRRYLTDDKRKSIEIGEAQSSEADGRDKKLAKEF